MRILPLTLTGPMQSYGYASRYPKNRDAGTGFPTMSAVIGMLANICDIHRDQPELLHSSGFTDLDIVVRVDQPGKRERDFQTVVYTRKGVAEKNKIIIKEYLTDAKFLVGVYAKGESGEDALDLIERNIVNPKNQLFLGRKSYAPDSIAIHPIQNHEDVDIFMRTFPLLTSRHPIKVTVISTTKPGDISSMVIDDIPLSFEQGSRKYASRSITISKMKISDSDESSLSESGRSQYDFNPMSIIDDMFMKISEEK